MSTQSNKNYIAVNDSTSQIDEALRDIRKAISSENNVRSDILELTEIVEDNIASKQPSQQISTEAPTSLRNEEAKTDIYSERSEDILKKIDNSVAAKKLRTSPTKPNKEEDIQGSIPSASQAIPSDHNTIEEQDSPNRSYIAEEVAKESQDLIRSFIKATSKQSGEVVNFRSGTTLEDLVIELLKPELSEWLNRNLPTIVKNVVEKEVKKLIPQDE